MKKSLRFLILTFLILCLAVPLPAGAAALKTGDIDGDGTVTAIDARLVLRASVGLVTLSSAQRTAADVDRDGEVTAMDARLILRASVDLEDLSSYGKKITGYTVEREQFRKYGGDDGFFFFDVVRFTGKNNVVKVLNDGIIALKNEYEETVVKKNAARLDTDKNKPYYHAMVFQPRALENVYYDDACVSVGWSWKWFAGGISDNGFAGFNYDLKTMQPLTIGDILGEDAEEILLDAIERYGMPLDHFYRYYPGFEYLAFYFDAANVYVSIGPNRVINLTIPRQ